MRQVSSRKTVPCRQLRARGRRRLLRRSLIQGATPAGPPQRHTVAALRAPSFASRAAVRTARTPLSSFTLASHWPACLPSSLQSANFHLKSTKPIRDHRRFKLCSSCFPLRTAPPPPSEYSSTTNLVFSLSLQHLISSSLFDQQGKVPLLPPISPFRPTGINSPKSSPLSAPA